MKIWLIRHGITRLGEEQRYQGCLDEGLSEKGRDALLRADLAYPCVFGGKTGSMPACVYVSPARRARQTSEILFPQAEQIVIPGLREMDFGVFEGRSWREMQEDPDYRSWVDSGCEGQCPGGEDRASFSKRICSAFDGILDREFRESGTEMRCAGEKREDAFDGILDREFRESGAEMRCAGEKRRGAPIIIVAHGGTQMALLAERGSPPGDYFSRQTPCGCGWLLEPEESTGFLKVLREVRFLRT